MAQVIATEEMFFTAFEPKTANRFIMYMDGVPAYLIKSVTRPNLTIDVQTMDHINIKRKLNYCSTRLFFIYFYELLTNLDFFLGTLCNGCFLEISVHP